MVNDCIRIGLECEKTSADNQTPSMKKLSSLSYRQIRSRYGGYASYASCASSMAAGILASRKKSIRRGFPTSSPYVKRPLLVSCFGFKVEGQALIFHVDSDKFESISLSPHTISALSDPSTKIRSFALTPESLCITIAKETSEIPALDVNDCIGIDRNLRNVTVGNHRKVFRFEMGPIVDIGENTRAIVRSFRRNDARIGQQIRSKYGRRRANRVKQFLHLISRRIVELATEERGAIVFEDLRGIRGLYSKRNPRGRRYRAEMNSWPFGELKTQIEYKAGWAGIPTLTLSRSETSGTTMDCPRCGERLQAARRDDGDHYRHLWCRVCGRWQDRDVVAVMNISQRGRLRFDRSRKKGEASEAMKGNVEHEGEPLILRVDASKLRLPRETM